MIVRMLVTRKCQYSTFLAAVKDRLQQGLPLDNLPRLSEKVFVSTECLWRNPLTHHAPAVDYDYLSELYSAPALESDAWMPVMLSLTPSKLLLASATGTYEIIIANITAIDFDFITKENPYPYLVIGQLNGQYYYFARVLIEGDIEKCCWQILLIMVATGIDLNNISDSNIGQLLKPHRYLIARHALPQETRGEMLINLFRSKKS